jgi:hypothetical protein
VSQEALNTTLMRTLAAGSEALRTTTVQVPPGVPPAAKCSKQIAVPALLWQPWLWSVSKAERVPVIVFIVTAIAEEAGARTVTS